MKKIYLFFCSLAIIMVAFSPANAQRKNTTKHDITPSSIMEKIQNKDDTDCQEVKKLCKRCKHLKKECKKEWKDEHKEHKDKHHKKYDD